MQLHFESLQLPSGLAVALAGELDSLDSSGTTTLDRESKQIVGNRQNRNTLKVAVIGAITGGALGLPFGAFTGHPVRGPFVGAAAGAATGVAALLLAPGPNATIPADSRLVMVLTRDLTLPADKPTLP